VDNSLVVVAVAAAVVALAATVFAWRAGRRARGAADLVAELLEPATAGAAIASSGASSAAASAASPVPSSPAGRSEDPTAVDAATELFGALPSTDPLASPTEAASHAVDDPTSAPAPRSPLEGSTETSPAPTPVESPFAGVDPASFGVPELSFRGEERHEPLAPARPDPTPTRIPVLDLDRLRSWLTLGDVNLGRLAIVSVELDNLAFVEERLGYAAGAHLIEAITQRLRTVTRLRDVVAHVSRERFVLVCRDVPDRQTAEGLAERIAMGVAHPSVVLAGVAEVTASIGVALASHLDERPEGVLRRAIKAGNRARELGGARIEISDAPPGTTFEDGELTAAIARDELRVHYLPIVSCATGRIAGFEALVRWEHPEHGLLLPGSFLPEAETQGTIVPVGLWAIEHACRQMASWQQQSGAALKLDLNLSARQFAEPALPAQLERIFGETGLAPGAVWIEITEATLLADHTASEHTMGRLHDLGVRTVIDDFGTGASSLVSLKQFPLDAIKIASTFVGDLGRDRDSDAICRAIVDLAHSLGLCAIAEGVETLEQFAALRTVDCELAQGHLFGPARPAVDYGATPAAMLGIVGSADGASPR
jgi:diguanylate cyclase (GGDEF)-like protein